MQVKAEAPLALARSLPKCEECGPGSGRGLVNLRHVDGRDVEEEGRGKLQPCLGQCSRCHPWGVSLEEWGVDAKTCEHYVDHRDVEEEGRGDLNPCPGRCSRCHPWGVSLEEWGVDVRVRKDGSKRVVAQTTRACRTWNVAGGAACGYGGAV